MKKDIKTRLRKYLMEGKSITQLQALKIFRTTRLASYINRLRNDGMVIKTNMVHSESSIYARYYHEI